MKLLGERTSDLGVKRKFYADDDKLIVKKTHNHDDYEPIWQRNLDAQTDVRFAPNVRKIAEIPQDLYDSWVYEANCAGYYDQETIMAIVNFKLSDPDNKKFLSVPDSYRIRKN